MQPLSRLDRIPPYLFAELERKIAAKRAAGVDVISLGIGDPDRPTPALIVEAMQEAVAEPGTHQYPSNRGRPEFREAVQRLLRAALRRRASTPRREVIPALGRQGVHLQPQPRLPRSRATSRWPPTPAIRCTRAARCSPAPSPSCMPLAARARLRARTSTPSPPRDRRAGEADVPQLPQQPHRRRRARGLLRPRGRVRAGDTTCSSCTTTPTRDHLRRLRRAPSFLATPGAKDVGVEVFSLSKGYNMTGWRCAAILGHADAIDAYWRLKTNIDSGMFEAVQLAGVAALSPDADGDKAEMNVHLHAPPRPRGRGAARRPASRSPRPRGRSTSGRRCPRATERGASTASTCSTRPASWSRPASAYGPNGEGFFRISLTDARRPAAARRWSGSAALESARTAAARP